MTDNETISLGEYCEDLLQQDGFTTLVNEFELQTVHDILQTKPLDKERREAAYHSFTGLRDFLGLMKAHIEMKNEVKANLETPALSEDTDALPQEFDN